MRKPLETPIEDLDLTVRSRTRLRAAGIDTCQDLIQWSQLDLLDIKYVNGATLDEVIRELGLLGLQLRDDRPPAVG